MITRRKVLLGASALAVTACSQSSPRSAMPAKRMAITMDDFNLGFEVRQSVTDRNAAILAAFAAHNHKAAGFVTGRYVDWDMGRSVVQSWSDAGHVIGNHTFTHANSSQTEAEIVKADIRKNHQFLSAFTGYKNAFRFPYLAEGGTPEKIADYREFLAAQNLRNAPVTIDSIDWFVSSRLEKRLRDNPDADVSGYRDYYVRSVVELSEQKHELAVRLGIKNLPHMTLMHHNILNGLFLRDVMDALVEAGWTFVDAQVALADPFYDRKPMTPNRGRSMLSVLAQEADIPHGFPKAYNGFGKATLESAGL